MSTLKKLLFQLTRELNALQYGQFVLTAGQPSSYYFDGRLLTLHPQALSGISRELLLQIRNSGGQAVGGPTLGADPMVGGIISASSLDQGTKLTGFLIRKAAKEHGAQRLIEGHLPAGQPAALVDDTCSYGNTLLQAAQTVEAAGCPVSLIAVILDREEDGGSARLREKGYPFISLLTSAELRENCPPPRDTAPVQDQRQ